MNTAKVVELDRNPHSARGTYVGSIRQPVSPRVGDIAELRINDVAVMTEVVEVTSSGFIGRVKSVELDLDATWPIEIGDLLYFQSHNIFDWIAKS